MIVTVRKQKPEFEPFTITITITTPEELAEFFIRLVPIDKKSFSDFFNKKYNINLFDINREQYDKLFDIVDNHLEATGYKELVWNKDKD